MTNSDVFIKAALIGGLTLAYVTWRIMRRIKKLRHKQVVESSAMENRKQRRQQRPRGE